MAELKFVVSTEVGVDENTVYTVIDEFLSWVSSSCGFKLCTPDEDDELMPVTKSQKELLINQFISTCKGEA